MDALADIRDKWGRKYPYAVSNWENNWDDVSSFFQFPDEVRRIMYTTNVIEGLNRQYPAFSLGALYTALKSDENFFRSL